MDVQVTGRIMIAMPLTYSGFSKPRASNPANSQTCFQPLDPGVLDASIPAFFIGRDSDGFWLARDVKGEIGGIFLFKSSALAFARRVSGRACCATIFPSERFELDVENHGNPLIMHLKRPRRLALAGWRRAVALTRGIVRAIAHRAKGI
jgi:hypothetical protein